MGLCSSTAKPEPPSPVETVMQMYKSFGEGDIAAILKAGGPECVFDASDFGPNVPYRGLHKGTDAVGGFFQSLGAAWGTTPPIAFIPSDFHVEGSVVTSKVTIRHLTPSGGVLFGVETHTWTGISDGKWASLKVTDCGFHEAAFDPAASQPELLCKLAWTLFGEGKTDQIIANLMGEGAVFELFADLPEGTAVPYAGSFTEGWERPFGAMFSSWKIDDTFHFEPTSFEADGCTVVMSADIDCLTAAGRNIKGTEAHTAVVAAGPTGALTIKSWVVSGSAHHAAAFDAE